MRGSTGWWGWLCGTLPMTACAGPCGPSAAAVGEALQSDPDRLALLNPPFVVAVHDQTARSLTVVNDPIATARLYELRTDAGFVWSNRLGALPLFAGVAPAADPEGWAIHAATGWFLGDTTPIRGARKVAPGTAIVARAMTGGAQVSACQTDAVRGLVQPRRISFRRSAAGLRVAAHQLADLTISSWFVRHHDSRQLLAGTAGGLGLQSSAPTRT